MCPELLKSVVDHWHDKREWIAIERFDRIAAKATLSLAVHTVQCRLYRDLRLCRLSRKRRGAKVKGQR